MLETIYPVCPYCEFVFKSVYAHEIEEYKDVEEIMVCRKCEKEFIASCAVTITWDTFRKGIKKSCQYY